MPRKGPVAKRKVPPDPKYHSELATECINCLMWEGKKRLAESIFYNALDFITKEVGEDGFDVFKRAVENVKPLLEVKPRRVGGSTYQVPVDVRPERRTALALKWIIHCARRRPEYTMFERLARELIDASKKLGTAIKRREDTHKMAEANKAFAHFKW
jgi:small subunit ribosomal protein S7